MTGCQVFIFAPAVGGGFEPPVPYGTDVFETSALGHYAIPPWCPWRESNPQPHGPQPCVLSVELQGQHGYFNII